MLGAGALIASVALAACSSNASGAGTSPSTGPSVVDGITIPPPYVPPTPTVVPGPSSCPGTFASALAAGGSGHFTLRSQHTAHLLTCSYRNPQAGRTSCSSASVRVNTEPQAFTAFNRWNVETGQNSMWSSTPKLQPIPVSGIGIEAEWVPALRELGAADETTWVTVVVGCPGSASVVPALAKTLAKAALASAE